MKKVTMIIMVLAILCLAGCSSRKPATLEVTSSEGFAGIVAAYNSKEAALKDPHKIVLEEGEAVTLRFWCEKCEHDETIEIKAEESYSHLFMCACENYKEYSAILIGRGEPTIE